MQAVAVLNKLAIDAAAMTDEQWHDLKPYFDYCNRE
jgi:hypothetical protein